MRIDIATLFPEMCEAVLSESIVGRARRAGHIQVVCHQIRDYSQDKRRRVDDYGYGGGKGMVMQADPIFRCHQAICRELGGPVHTIYLSPQGKVLTQERCVELSRLPGLLLLCGHYEGVDERVLETVVDEELSIGDYVLTGGELPALVLADAVARMCPGVLAAEECFQEESHFGGLLEYPQYSRPEVWEGRPVPEVLLSGHHGNVDRWRQKQRLLRTLQKRPDMMARYQPTKLDQKLLEEIRREDEGLVQDACNVENFV